MHEDTPAEMPPPRPNAIGAGAVGRRSLLTYRLFPAAVGLWFAALFGLGCLVMPSFLLGRLLGLGPINLASQAVVALIFAAGAGALAHYIASRMARRVRPGALAGPVQEPAGQAVEVTEPEPPLPVAAPPASLAVEPIDLGALFENNAPDADNADTSLNWRAYWPDNAGAETAPPEATPETDLSPLQSSEAEQEPEPAPALVRNAPPTATPLLKNASLDSLGSLQLLERLALALAEHGQPGADRPLPAIPASLLAKAQSALDAMTPAPLDLARDEPLLRVKNPTLSARSPAPHTDAELPDDEEEWSSIPADEEDDWNDAVEDKLPTDGYASLLSMTPRRRIPLDLGPGSDDIDDTLDNADESSDLLQDTPMVPRGTDREAVDLALGHALERLDRMTANR